METLFVLSLRIPAHHDDCARREEKRHHQASLSLPRQTVKDKPPATSGQMLSFGSQRLDDEDDEHRRPARRKGGRARN
jgi:hypothetical protein